MTWEGLTPPYATIVADPPWHYEQAYPQAPQNNADAGRLPYSSMSLDEIRALPVGELGTDARCFLWTTNRHLRHAWSVLEAWGFEPQNRVLVWCKQPRATKRVTTEFVLLGKRGRPATMPWHGTTWFQWSAPSGHSRKPEAFLDLVEAWCEPPYVELFSRTPRFGWDSWGYGYESVERLPEQEAV
jgi:N6-adenosine-specific RNA methylase IME4